MIDLTSIKASIQAICLQVMAFVNFHPVFSGLVVAQNADGSLEWQPDSSFLPGLSKVPVRTPAPGFTFQVAPNTRCGVVFENGDRQQPVAVLFEPNIGTTLKVTVNATQAVDLVAPAIGLGPQPTQPLILGTIQKGADDSYDTAVEAAVIAYDAALVTANLPSLIATLAVAPGPVAGAAAAAVFTPLVAALAGLTSALQTGATTHTSARAAVLSNVSKTA